MLLRSIIKPRAADGTDIDGPRPKKRLSSRRKRRRQTIQISLALVAGAALFVAVAVFFVIRPLAKREPAVAAHQSVPGNIVVRPGRAVPDSAIEELKRRALTGDASAQNDLGVLYQLGRSVGQDDLEAVRWYRRAAVRNSPLAQNNLGWMHEHGRGLERDYAGALFWYKLAAQSGNAAAQHNLASLYERGLGLPPNRILAAEWYERAVKQGDETARAGLERVSTEEPAEASKRAPVQDDAMAAQRAALATPGFLRQVGVKAGTSP